MIERMSEISLWIDHVDRLRETDELLARGYWHGYMLDHGGRGAAPMSGAYYLVRWAQPTVAVSHDDQDEVVRLARLIETALLPSKEESA